MPVPDEVTVSSIVPEYMRRSIPYECFNRMQSKCLEAWDSDENLLVAAPTGSGKTVCFELAILRHIHKALKTLERKHLNFGTLQGKIVFLAPTKALCTEKEAEWKKKFGYLGLVVEVITGDVDKEMSDAKLASADLILTTAEKLDVLTRSTCSGGASDLTTQIALILLDEVHQLGDSRGAKFEAVVTRLMVTNDECRRAGKTTAEAQSTRLRIVAVSATIQNAADIGSWLRVSPELVKEFDQSYRPVKLAFHVLPCQIKNPWQSSKVFDTKILDVLGRFAERKPALIFCPSRRQSMLSAKFVANELKQKFPDLKAGNALTRSISPEGRQELLRCASFCKDKALANLLANGVAVHNADMSAEHRHLVEELFRKTLIKCLFATSTLAQGVNLPARLVVIAGTAVYQDGRLQEYDPNLTMQMCGRAGRPGLDSLGVVVIMTPRASAKLYENIGNTSPSMTESQLETGLEECFNAEVARLNITDVPGAISFLGNTYYAVLERRKLCKEQNSAKLHSRLQSTAMKALKALSLEQLIRIEDDGFEIGCTPIGMCMARYCVSFESMRTLVSQVPTALSPAKVLRIIATCPEVLQGICVRRSEKKKLNELNAQVRLPIRGKVKDPADKVVVLLQVVMSNNLESVSSDFALHSEARRLTQVVSRIARCILALVLERSVNVPYESFFALLQACRAVLCRTYWDGTTTLLQIPSIDHAVMKKLVKVGISTIEALANTSNADIDSALQGKINGGQTIRQHLRNLPKFHVEVHCRQDSSNTIHINIKVSLSAQVGKWTSSRNSSMAGFILFGSHAVGLIGVKTFKLSEDGHTSMHALFSNSVHNGKWVDVIVGCDSIVGTDVTKRINLPRDQTHNVEILEQTLPLTSRRPAFNHKKRTFRSMTTQRVSKRLKQDNHYKPLSLVPCPEDIDTPERLTKLNAENPDSDKAQQPNCNNSPNMTQAETSAPLQLAKEASVEKPPSTKTERCDSQLNDTETHITNGDSDDSESSTRNIQTLHPCKLDNQVEPTTEYDDIWRALF